MLTVAEASARILAAVRPLGPERLDLLAARGRVLARDLASGRDLPPWDNSAMDGFAVRAADCAAPGTTLAVVAEVPAGRPTTVTLGPGQAARIFTGAPMPAGADAVVMQEDTDHGAGVHGRVTVRVAVPPGAHVRHRGEDLARGARGLAAGTALGPGELGLLAALGHARVTVHRAPRVAILSTGDELVDVDETPGDGQIVSSNAFALAAQAAELGSDAVVLPIARDDRDEIAARMREALSFDAVLSSGGVSVGDHDHVKGAMTAVGLEVAFWKVAMKPGKPVAFGVLAGPDGPRPFFGLPGNPVSSMVSFELFARPALRRMMGHALADDRPRVTVRLAAAIGKAPGRASYVRARLERDGDAIVATPNPRQSSGALTSMVGVDALLELPAERGDAAAGEPITAIVLRLP